MLGNFLQRIKNTKVDTEVVESPDTVLKEVSSLQFESLSHDELTAYGEKASSAILAKIQFSSERIARAKRKSSDAESMEVGFIRGPSKNEKISAVAEGLVATNEAIHEMNELMRALITYTQLNGKLSKVMNGAMAKMISKGFKDRDGHIVTLNENGEEFAKIVMGEAEEFSNRQLEVEKLQAGQSKQIKDIKDESLKRSQENEEKISTLREHTESLVKKNSTNVAANKTGIKANSSSINANSSNINANSSNIDSNRSKIEEALSKIDENYESQVGEIKLLKRVVMKQQEKIALLEKHSLKVERASLIANSSILLAIIAISLSVWLLIKMPS